jgi:uncharacterized protein
VIRLLSAATLALLPSIAYAQQASTVPLVITSGEGIVRAVPDRAFVSISAESRAASPREAQRRNADAMKPVQDKLRGAGIPADAIRTTAISVHQDFDYPNGKRASRGYVAINAIEVRVDALDRLGELLDTVVMAGATSLGGIRFDVKDNARHERQAMQMAVQDAKARAEAAAAGAGKTLDVIQRIEEQGVSTAPPPMMRMAREAAVGQVASDTPVAAGEMEFRARVTLTATIK